MSAAPLIPLLLGASLLTLGPRLHQRAQNFALPFGIALVMVSLWSAAVEVSGTATFPSPTDTALGMLELIESARLWSDTIASLFRVSWGFFLATLVGVPLGLVAGWSTRAYTALNPIIQALRPISPIAWIPIAILWFGIGDGAGLYLIWLSAFFPITVGSMAAVRNVSLVHQRSAQNFGLSGLELFRRVVLPASLPQIITSLRIALGVAWLVIVATIPAFVAGAAFKRVAARTADDAVRAQATDQGVGPAATDHRVVAGAAIDQIAGRIVEGLDTAVCRCVDGMFHFHGLQHDQARALCDGLPCADSDIAHQPGHWSQDSIAACPGTGSVQQVDACKGEALRAKNGDLGTRQARRNTPSARTAL